MDCYQDMILMTYLDAVGKVDLFEKGVLKARFDIDPMI